VMIPLRASKSRSLGSVQTKLQWKYKDSINIAEFTVYFELVLGKSSTHESRSMGQNCNML
jgi:hypothetical protein